MKIFISHAVADKALAARYVQLLKQYANLNGNDIFCSSIEGHGVETGKEWVKEIVTQYKKSKIVIYLLTRQFLQRPNCVIELGWSLLYPGKTFCYVEEEPLPGETYPSFLEHRQRLTYNQSKAAPLLSILQKSGADTSAWQQNRLKTARCKTITPHHNPRLNSNFASGGTLTAPFPLALDYVLRGWMQIETLE